MAIWQFFDANIYINQHARHKKKGSAETTLPHGLDESYNHLSRDILFCVCSLVGRVKEHSARTYTSRILMLLLTSAVILHYIAVTIIVGIAIIAQSTREHEDMTIQWVGENAAWAHRHLRECNRLWLCTSCCKRTHTRSAAIRCIEYKEIRMSRLHTCCSTRGYAYSIVAICHLL